MYVRRTLLGKILSTVYSKTSTINYEYDLHHHIPVHQTY